LLGIDVISRESPWLLEIVKAVGASYLVYLGVTTWRDADNNSSLMQDAKEVSAAAEALDRSYPDARSLSSAAVSIAPSNIKLFRAGVWVSLSNPKAILFFAAFFPKFINFSAPLWPQYILLTVGLFMSETIWQMIYMIGGKKLAGWLEVGHRLAWLNRICGIIFIVIAAALLTDVIKGFMA
jgi:threonine/homoserine/homoserine lactone efflux protein